MIVVAGYARTGTSVIFECLKRSGFEPGSRLFGHKYMTQHTAFNEFNRILTTYAMETINSKNPSDWPLRKEHITEQWIFDEMKAIGETLEYEGVEIIKDPQGGPVCNAWVEVVPQFKDAKFIRTFRNPHKVAMSNIRMQYYLRDLPIKEEPLNGQPGYLDLIHTYVLHDKLWQKTINGKDSISVVLEQLVENPRGEAARLSEFIGREFNTEIINADDSFERSGEVH